QHDSARKETAADRRQARQPLAARHHLAVSVDHLDAAGPVIGPGGSAGRGCARTYRDRAPGGAPRHASIAHRRQRASNPRLGRGDESFVSGGLAVPEQAGGKCRGGGNSDKQLARDGHFLAPAGVPGGSSSNSMMTVESSATLVASGGGLNAK